MFIFRLKPNENERREWEYTLSQLTTEKEIKDLLQSISYPPHVSNAEDVFKWFWFFIYTILLML